MFEQLLQTVKGVPAQAWTGQQGSRRLRLPEGGKSCQPQVPATFIFPPPRRHPCYSFLLEAGLTPQGQGAVGKIKSLKNSNDPFGNRTCDLPGCRALPQLTAPPCAPPPKGQRCTLICSLHSVHFDMPKPHVKELLDGLHMQQKMM